MERYGSAIGTSPRSDLYRRGSPFLVHANKLWHDVEQLTHLINAGRLPGARFWPVVQGYLGALGGGLTRPPDDFGFFVMDAAWFAAVGRHAGSLVYLPPAPAPGHPALEGVLNPARDFVALERDFLAATPQLVVVDDFLAPAALASLVEFCTEATVFYDTRVGYLGAYFEEGLAASPVVLAVVEALRAALPGVIGDLPLVNAWVYKYDSEERGIAVHADSATVNLNLWLTPDEANLDPASGGLVVYEKEPPADWSFDDYNHFSTEVRGAGRGSGGCGGLSNFFCWYVPFQLIACIEHRNLTCISGRRQ